MEVILPLIIAALLIWLDWYLAKQFYEAAQDKGYDEKKYFWIAFWLNAVGYLLVIALPDRKTPQQPVIITRDAAPVIPQVPSDELPDL